MCGALAIRLPSVSNSAHEKSRRSLMFTEYAVFCSATPICSAIAMNRLLKTSSITGSTSVPIARRAVRGTTRVITMWSSGVTSARQPGSTTVVALASAMIAGPSMRSPGRSTPRTNSAASCHAPAPYIRTRCDAASGPSRGGGSITTSSMASAWPIASTEIASRISSRFGIRNE